MRKYDKRSHPQEVKMPNGGKYTFIGVDANLQPGPKRPFNFFGNLDQVVSLLNIHVAY